MSASSPPETDEWLNSSDDKVRLRKETAVTMKYRTNETATSAFAVPEQVTVAMAEIGEDMRENLLGLAVPDQVSVAMAEIAEDMREGLLRLAVGAGLQVMDTLMEADVTAVCGPRGSHNPERTGVRHGRERGSVTLGGRRVAVKRPRVRAANGTGEVAVPSYELFTSTEVLGKMAMERMLAGLSTGRDQVDLAPVAEAVDQAAMATSRSAVWHKFVAMAEHAFADLLAADLSELDLAALMVDGVHLAGHSCVVALGVDIDGVKHPLAVVEGSTENAALVTELCVDLRERGLDVSKPILAVLDGQEALRRAVTDTFDHPVITHGPLHTTRQVYDEPPKQMRSLEQQMRDAYHGAARRSPPAAWRGRLTTVARALELGRSHTGVRRRLRRTWLRVLDRIRPGHIDQGHRG